jgi:hypothetical protein
MRNLYYIIIIISALVITPIVVYGALVSRTGFPPDSQIDDNVLGVKSFGYCPEPPEIAFVKNLDVSIVGCPIYTININGWDRMPFALQKQITIEMYNNGFRYN